METKDLEAFTVFKDNRIIEAAYHLSLVEQRIILSCLSQVYPVYGKTLTDEVFFRITADEYSELFHVDKLISVLELRNGVKSLYKREILNETDEGDFESFRWLSHIKYKSKEGLVEMRFCSGIIPFLSDLNKENCPHGYTKYKLKLVSQMNSPNSIRLYEILVQKVGMGGERTVRIDWLREQLCLNDKYMALGSFKRFVLDPALEQIKKHSNLEVSVKKALKHSREIYGYVYDIKYKEGMEPLKQAQKPSEAQNTDLMPLQASQLPMMTSKEQAPQVYKSYQNANTVKKSNLSDVERQRLLIAEDEALGLANAGQYFNN